MKQGDRKYVKCAPLSRTHSDGSRVSVYDLIIIIGILIATLVSWGMMIHFMSARAMTDLLHQRSFGEEVASHMPMWVAMFIGMMLPLATVSIIGSSRDRSGRILPFAGLCFGTGYVSACLVFALIATAIEQSFSPATWRTASIVGFCIVGLYQFTPMKLRALSMCKGDLFRSRVKSSMTLHEDLKSGVRHATGCFTCCGLAMLTPLFLGMTNVSFMAALFLWMLLEQAGWISAAGTRVLGASWISFGLFAAFKLHSGARAPWMS